MPDSAPSASPLSRVSPKRKTARVLLALSAERSVPRAIQEASAFARQLGAELHLVRVVPHLDSALGGPPRDLVQCIRDADRVLAATRHTRRVSDRMLPETLPGSSIRVRLGSFVERVAQRARELDAPICVVPAGTRHLASVATELARRTGRPVLVPRGDGPLETLLAATDLQRSHAPVLAKACELARELGAGVVALHSLSDSSGGAAPPEAFERCRRKLEHVARNLGGPLDPVVVDAADPVWAILSQARARNAGLIVVGARAEGSADGTAARLVRSAASSVLIAPLERVASCPTLATG